MRRFTTFASCLGLAVMLSGCTVGSGEIITQTRSVEGFDEIDLRGTGEVRITVDGTESLTIEAEDNIIDHLTSDVSGSTLILGVDRPITPTEDIIYTVTMASLEGIEISGSGAIEVSDFSTEDFAVDLSISGSGSFDGDRLTTDTGDVDISGSGSATVNVSEILDVQVSGSGNVEYIGDPSVSVDSSGSGRVSRR